MADDGLLVTISGSALSLLFYENVRVVGDQMGFFLGEVVKYVTKNVTDAERQIESTKLHIDIQGILPCSSSDLIHEGNGKISPKKLRDFVKNKGKQIVGWYRFRPNNALHPTLRDKILHKQLANFFYDAKSDVANHYFIACMLNYATTKQGGTHKFRHVFLRYKDGVYQPIPLKINNLGADASRHDGSDYKPTPIRRQNYEPDYFTKFVNSLNVNWTQTPGIESIAVIQRAAERHLSELVPLICKSDCDVTSLETKVLQMRTAIQEIHTAKCMALSNENYPSGEPHHHSKRKNEDEQSNRILTSEISTLKTTKVFDDTKYVKTPSISNNMNLACNTPESTKKTPSSKLAYSQALKKPADTTDCS